MHAVQRLTRVAARAAALPPPVSAAPIANRVASSSTAPTPTSVSTLKTYSISTAHRQYVTLLRAPRLLAQPRLSSFGAPSPFAPNAQQRRYYSNDYRSAGDPGFLQQKPPSNLGVVIVPQQSAYVIERFGKFRKVLTAGLHFLVPLVDRIAYNQNLKEQAISVPNQMAITLDNVTITIDGVLYIKIDDPAKASYGVSDIYFAMIQLAQTTMRSELGKLTLDKTFAEREQLNAAIVEQINKASEAWGVVCLRYEIRDISPPEGVREAMDLQAEAERRKRATVLDSEGAQQSEINRAQGNRAATILAAEGQAEAIIAKARASATGITMVAEALQRSGGNEAVAMRIAEQYVEAFGNIAQKGTTMLLPSDAGNPASMVAQALGIYQQIRPHTRGATSAPAVASSSSPSTSAAAAARRDEDLLFEQASQQVRSDAGR